MIKKIVILGPESTGKSSLCEELAQHFNTLWVPEYARTYLLEHGMNYSYPDLLTIAKGQLALEEKYIDDLQKKILIHTPPSAHFDLRLPANRPVEKHYLPFTIHHSPLTTHHPLLFVDTNMYVMKVWCEFVFSRCHDWILYKIAQRKYDLYLLCDTDLPWVKDELREYPDLESRQKLFHIYKDIMINQSVPWIEISGNYKQRFAKAVAAMEMLFKV